MRARRLRGRLRCRLRRRPRRVRGRRAPVVRQRVAARGKAGRREAGPRWAARRSLRMHLLADRAEPGRRLQRELGGQDARAARISLRHAFNCTCVAYECVRMAGACTCGLATDSAGTRVDNCSAATANPAIKCCRSYWQCVCSSAAACSPRPRSPAAACRTCSFAPPATSASTPVKARGWAAAPAAAALAGRAVLMALAVLAPVLAVLAPPAVPVAPAAAAVARGAPAARHSSALSIASPIHLVCTGCNAIRQPRAPLEHGHALGHAPAHDRGQSADKM